MCRLKEYPALDTTKGTLTLFGLTIDCLSRLCKTKNAEKKLAVTVFSFPPDKGNVGTAAYLNVFGSIFKVLESLQREGYNVGDLPENGEGLIQSVSLNPFPMNSIIYALTST